MTDVVLFHLLLVVLALGIAHNMIRVYWADKRTKRQCKEIRRAKERREFREDTMTEQAGCPVCTPLLGAQHVSAGARRDATPSCNCSETETQTHEQR